MIQFARAIGLEFSLATFGLLEDVLLKIGGKTGRNIGERGSGQSASLGRSGSTVMESVASRSFYSLPTITESFDSDHLAGDFSQQPCSSRQADAAMDFSRTEVTEINDTDSLKTLGQIRSDARKKSELYKWSREGRPNPISPSGSDGGGYVFTEEMLEIAPFAKIFATGPKNPSKNRYCFYCMICRRNVSMKSRGLYELKRHFQRTIIWGQIKGFVPGIILQKHVDQMGVLCTGPSWKLRRSCLCIWMCQSWIINVRSTMMLLKENRLPLLRQVLELWNKLSCCWFFWEEEANCGHWKNTGPRWECWWVILWAPLTSIGVPAIFL